LLRRWEGRVGGENGVLETLDIAGLKMNDLEAALYDVAFHVHAGQGDAEGAADIGEGLLRQRVAPYLNNDYNKAGLFVEYVRERAGLLIRHKTDAYTFPHRTFQEFMAACHLAGKKDYPHDAKKLIYEDPDRWRIVFILAAGHAARTHRLGMAIAAVNTLCPAGLDESEKPDAAAFHRAEIVAEALLEIGLVGVRREPDGKAVLARVQKWLVKALEADTILAPKERAEAGNILDRTGDTRFNPACWYLPDDKNMGFVKIPSGPFLMGSDKKRDRYANDEKLPQHTVTLSAYAISRYPVTVAQFRVFIEESGYQTDEDWEDENQHGNHPAVNVSWHDATAYCEWLTSKLKDRGWEIQLPTEAQWEKAARGTDGRIYPWGDESLEPNLANYGGKLGTTSPAGSFPGGASPYRIYDMSGNVLEWCRDWYDEAYYKKGPSAEPQGPEKGSERVLRGGFWYFHARYCRAAFRNRNLPGNRRGYVGFRLARLPGQQ